MIDRETLDNKKQKINEFKEVCADMNTVAQKIKELPKGQLKKVLTSDIIAIFNKYGSNL